MQYEILQFNKLTGSALVRFWNDQYLSGLEYSIDIPVENEAYIAGERLHSWIISFAPIAQIERLINVASTDSTNIEALVVGKKEVEVTSDQLKPVDTREKIFEDLNKKLNAKLTGGFAHNGDSYSCDGVFQQQVMTFIGLHDSGSISSETKMSVRKFNDEMVDLDISQVKALAADLFEYVQAIYVEYWQAKDSIPG